MNKYPKYKPSNIPWLGDVPEHWEVLYLSQTCKEQLIKNTNNAETNVLSLSYGNIIRKSNIYSGLSPKDFATYQIVDKGNIILRLTDLQNDHVSLRTGLVRERGIITSAYTCLKPFGNEAYLQYLLHAYDTHKLFYGLGGGVRQSIGYKDIRYIQLPFPPLAEQTQIVHYLDEKLQRINKLTDAKKQQIDLLKEELHAYLFSDNGNKATLEYWDNCFPKHWKATTVKHLFHETSMKGYTNKELLAVTQDRGILYKKDCSENYVSPSGDYSSQKLVLPHHFVISLRSFQGGIETSFVEGLVSPAYTVFAMDNYNELLFIYYRHLFKTKQFIAYLNTLVADTRDGKKIGFKQFRDLYMPFPPISQLKIIKELSAKLDIFSSLQERYEQFLTEYKTRLISDVVTGKVNVQSIATDTAVNVVKQSEQQTKIIEVTPKQRKVHSKGYDDVVILTALVNYFGTDEHPFTAFDCQKFPYLLHRHIEGVAENYGKFAAGPYNPILKYETAQPIALKEKYIREHTGLYKGFIVDENASEAVNYFLEWYGNEPLEWINRFRYIPNRKDELELLTTVDMAMVELKESKEPITMQKVKDIIKTSPAWKAKLERPIFSDENIERAINWSYKLFGNNSL